MTIAKKALVGHAIIKGGEMDWWRARLGIMVPSPNFVIEPEFNRMVPSGVTVHGARLKLEGTFSLKKLMEMSQDIEKAAYELRPVADVIGYGCTSGSFAKGFGWDKELIKKIENLAKVPTTTTSTALVKALRTLEVERICIATPYPEEINQKERQFFKANSFDVIKIEGLGVVRHGESAKFHPITAFNLVRRIDHAKAQAIVISCTNFRTIEIIDLLERDLNKPVISANLATLWDMLRLLEIKDAIEGYGMLLKI